MAVFLFYNTIIYSIWAAVGSDYSDMVSQAVALYRLDLPLAAGGLFLLASMAWLRWWPLAIREHQSGGPWWAMIMLLVGMLGTIVVNGAAILWSAMATAQFAMLVAAGVMVGFNEELVARGVLVVGARGSGWGEARVAAFSALLFGAMHVPNMLFGLPWYAGLLQGVFASIMGGGFYVLRRVSGVLWPAMVVHGAWDFTSFSAQATNAHPPLSPYFQFGTYILAIVAVIVVLIHDSRHGRAVPGPS